MDTSSGAPPAYPSTRPSESVAVIAGNLEFSPWLPVPLTSVLST